MYGVEVAADSTALAADLRRILDEWLDSLPPRTGDLVRRRYGIGYDEHTLDEAGAAWDGLSKERVRQIIWQALHRFKKHRLYNAAKDYHTPVKPPAYIPPHKMPRARALTPQEIIDRHHRHWQEGMARWRQQEQDRQDLELERERRWQAEQVIFREAEAAAKANKIREMEAILATENLDNEQRNYITWKLKRRRMR
jgi:hypothetical protein